MSQQTQNIYITFVQRRPNVSDVGPTLYKCYTNVLCLLGLMSRIKKADGTQSIGEINIFSAPLEADDISVHFLRLN